MRKAEIHQLGKRAGVLVERETRGYRFVYLPDYEGEPISLRLPVRPEAYEFDVFPSFLEGLLPEGVLLDALLRRHKLDRKDLFSQLMVVGGDVVGSLTIQEIA